MSRYSEAVKQEIARQMMNYQKEIKIPFYSKEEVELLWYELEREFMFLFHLSKRFDYTYYSDRREAILNPTYLYSQADYGTMVARLRSLLKTVRERMSAVPTAPERELWIHDLLCKKVVYVDDGPESHTIIGPLLKGRGVCEGIAEAAKLLLDACGIPTLKISGIARKKDGTNEPHAWNVVLINGKWYHLDVTFDLTIARDHIRYDYFNLSTKEILKDRTIRPYYKFSPTQCHDDWDYYQAFHRYCPNANVLTNYLTRCIARRETYIQVRVAQSVSAATVPALFKQCLQTANVGASYQYLVNEARNIWEWTIQYK